MPDSQIETRCRPERLHLREWIEEEDSYSDDKFNKIRDAQDMRFMHDDLNEWVNGVHMYYTRARLWLDEARQLAFSENPKDQEECTHLRKLAQQAMAKAAMTAKNAVESSIRVYGDLPAPGFSSGNVEPWEDHALPGVLS